MRFAPEGQRPCVAHRLELASKQSCRLEKREVGGVRHLAQLVELRFAKAKFVQCLDIRGTDVHFAGCPKGIVRYIERLLAGNESQFACAGAQGAVQMVQEKCPDVWNHGAMKASEELKKGQGRNYSQLWAPEKNIRARPL